MKYKAWRIKNDRIELLIWDETIKSYIWIIANCWPSEEIEN